MTREPVALRKESVDRNLSCNYSFELFEWSLSARRAWIEMETMLPSWTRYASLSARRAWIEIFATISLIYQQAKVALRKESVDRNRSALG